VFSAGIFLRKEEDCKEKQLSYISPPHGATAPYGPGPPHYRGFMITLRHTTLGRSLLDE